MQTLKNDKNESRERVWIESLRKFGKSPPAEIKITTIKSSSPAVIFQNQLLKSFAFSASSVAFFNYFYCCRWFSARFYCRT